jgi:hypothetical protein
MKEKGDRRCVDCAAAGTIPLVDDHARFHGFLCDRCDRARRYRRMGLVKRWRHRLRRRSFV